MGLFALVRGCEHLIDAGLSLQIFILELCSGFVVGVLAQLVERLVRNEKVRSSSLLGSTIFQVDLLMQPSFFKGNTMVLLFYPQTRLASCA